MGGVYGASKGEGRREGRNMEQPHLLWLLQVTLTSLSLCPGTAALRGVTQRGFGGAGVHTWASLDSELMLSFHCLRLVALEGGAP